MKAWLSVVSLALAFCTAAQAASPERIVFALLGGYESCNSSTSADTVPQGIGLYTPYLQVEAKLKAAHSGLEIVTLVACLGSAAPPEAVTQYVVSTAPGKVQRADSDELLKILETLAGNDPLFIAGHSYGGWNSMYLSEKFKGTIAALFTLDPIGPACGPLEVFFGSDSCHSAPEDRDNKTIAKNVGHWANFYQTQDSWLTSSEVPEADENHHIKYSWGPHSDIDADQRVWDRIEAVTLGALAQ